MSEWPRLQVSDLCELIVDCVNKTAPRVEHQTQYKMIRTTNIKNGRIDLTTCRFVSKDTFEKWTKRAKVLKGDVLLTREAPMGEVALVNFEDYIFLGQRIVQYRVNRQKLLPDFLLYSFLSPDLQYQFRRHDGSGSIVSHIRVPDCLKFEIPLPPLSQQQKIARVLSVLDAKIDCNNRINAELEVMAKTLYDYWFVQFDFPDKNGKPYKSSGGKMVYNATLKRDIPAGWQDGAIGNLISLEYGKALKAESRTGCGYPVIGSNGVVGYHSEYIVAGPGIVVGRKGTVGAITYLNDNFFPIDTTYYVKPLIDVEFRYLKFLLGCLGLEKMNSDSAVPGLNREAVLRISVAMPTLAIIQQFESKTTPLFCKVRVIQEENQHLTQLRDWLLPMLMNGQVSVV